MCVILYDDNTYEGKHEVIKAPTLDYMVIRFDGRCVLGRTLEKCEKSTDYVGRLMVVDGNPVLILEQDADYESSLKRATWLSDLAYKNLKPPKEF